MAALLLSAAGLLSVRDDNAAGAESGGYAHGGWEWCEVCSAWVPGDFEAHELGSRHHESCRLAMVCLAFNMTCCFLAWLTLARCGERDFKVVSDYAETVLLQRYGRCRPRGSKGFRDATVVAVDKAREYNGLEAFAEGRRSTRSRPLLTEPHMCAVLQQAVHQELVLSCGSKGAWFTHAHTLWVLETTGIGAKPARLRCCSYNQSQMHICRCLTCCTSI